jgi:hypothetical protein
MLALWTRDGVFLLHPFALSSNISDAVHLRRASNHHTVESSNTKVSPSTDANLEDEMSAMERFTQILHFN